MVDDDYDDDNDNSCYNNNNTDARSLIQNSKLLSAISKCGLRQRNLKQLMTLLEMWYAKKKKFKKKILKKNKTN